MTNRSGDSALLFPVLVPPKPGSIELQLMPYPSTVFSREQDPTGHLGRRPADPSGRGMTSLQFCWCETRGYLVAANRQGRCVTRLRICERRKGGRCVGVCRGFGRPGRCGSFTTQQERQQERPGSGETECGHGRTQTQRHRGSGERDPKQPNRSKAPRAAGSREGEWNGPKAPHKSGARRKRKDDAGEVKGSSRETSVIQRETECLTADMPDGRPLRKQDDLPIKSSTRWRTCKLQGGTPIGASSHTLGAEKPRGNERKIGNGVSMHEEPDRWTNRWNCYHTWEKRRTRSGLFQ